MVRFGCYQQSSCVLELHMQANCSYVCNIICIWGKGGFPPFWWSIYTPGWEGLVALGAFSSPCRELASQAGGAQRSDLQPCVVFSLWSTDGVYSKSVNQVQAVLFAENNIISQWPITFFFLKCPSRGTVAGSGRRSCGWWIRSWKQNFPLWVSAANPALADKAGDAHRGLGGLHHG